MSAFLLLAAVLFRPLLKKGVALLAYALVFPLVLVFQVVRVVSARRKLVGVHAK